MEFENFIGRQRNFLSTDQCESIIDVMYDKKMHDNVITEHDTGRSDTAVFLKYDTSLFKEINKKLFKSLEQYNTNYYLPDTSFYKNKEIKIKVSEDGGGFHEWHIEWSKETSLREIVWMVYLNDDFEGGHTEFKFINHSEKPETGKLIFFPAAYTHYHRASPDLKGQKYIVGGWFER